MEFISNYERTGMIETTVGEIRKRMKAYDTKEGKHGFITKQKFKAIIKETCEKYNQNEATIRMILKD